MTETEFMQLDGHRAEWVNGVTHFVPPVTVDHDDLRNLLIRVLGDLTDNSTGGKIHGEPFVAKLFDGSIRSPDVLFISGKNLPKLHRKRFNDGPDLVIEIGSADYVARDDREKVAEYRQAGVREYWIIDPLSKTFEVHRRNSRRKFTVVQPTDGRVYFKVIPKFFFDHRWLRAPLPRKAAVLKLMGL